MFPLIPALALAIFSSISSAFVILRIIIPILPPHPLSRRVAPAEFGLPNFRSLSSADKTHIWLASLDLLAVAIFAWQTLNEATGGPAGYMNAEDPASSMRLWCVLTIRQTCFLFIAAVTLMNIRMGRPASFGRRQWMLWAPTLLLVVPSTALAGIISGAGVNSLFVGLVSYSSTIAVLSTIAFGCLIGTLIAIKRNLAALNDDADNWPPVRLMEEKPRPSFATEEIDAIRDGASWITSNASSRRNSISTWSFSTHHTNVASSHHGHNFGRPQTGSDPSIPAKSSFWFSSSLFHDDNVPPVPPLPSPYGPLSPTSEALSDPDPFRRDIPSSVPPSPMSRSPSPPSPLPHYPRERVDSQSSWLTSTNGSHTTLTAWSYPTAHEESLQNASTPDLHIASTRHGMPALAKAQVLGGYGYAPGSNEGLAALATPSGSQIDIPVSRVFAWLATIWIPLGLSFPYLIMSLQNVAVPTTVSVLLILSVTLSSPLLVFNILFAPMPIPSGLFDSRGGLPSNINPGASRGLSDPPHKWSREYKRSMSASVTVVEGRPSGDVWLTNGDATDGKGKISRAMTMLTPMPKLSVLPPEEGDGESTLPLPLQNEDSSLAVTVHNTPNCEVNAEFGRFRNSTASSLCTSGADDSLAFASKIMIAQRHYSSLAQTVLVPGPFSENAAPTDDLVATTGAEPTRVARHSAHLRTRSVSSITGPKAPTTPNSIKITPPPSFPLPPTPPSVRAARLAALAHKKSFSSGFSFGRVDDMNEIDALTAGVLPLLVPGLNVNGMKIKEGDWTPSGTLSKSKGRKLPKRLNEFGADFSSPEVHSTPARRRPHNPKLIKGSAHKRKHLSLPSLGLGKDGVHSLATWSAEIRGALEHKVGLYTAVPSNVELGRRNTVFGAETTPNTIPNLHAAQEDGTPSIPKGGTGFGLLSIRTLGLRPEVPHGVETARSSMVSTVVPSPSAASTMTLFEDFEASLISSPQAESTPHNTVSKPIKQAAPPPLPDQNRRPSIVYIKSENNDPPMKPPVEPTPPSVASSFSQWSSWAVRPLMPRSSVLQRKMSTLNSGTRPGSPNGSLRTLSLLQDRNPNLDTASPATGGTRPLTLGKKQKSTVAKPVQDENARPCSTSIGRSQKLRPLMLTRSDTSKMRGIIRKNEVLPEVVVRPPSTSDHTGFAYTFRD